MQGGIIHTCYELRFYKKANHFKIPVHHTNEDFCRRIASLINIITTKSLRIYILQVHKKIHLTKNYLFHVNWLFSSCLTFLLIAILWSNFFFIYPFYFHTLPTKTCTLPHTLVHLQCTR